MERLVAIQDRYRLWWTSLAAFRLTEDTGRLQSGRLIGTQGEFRFYD
jgi:hypothetical protein